MNACIITRNSYDRTLHVDRNQSFGKQVNKLIDKLYLSYWYFRLAFLPTWRFFWSALTLYSGFSDKFQWKSKFNTKKTIGIDNHTKFCDWLLSISDICQLIGIDFYQQLLIFIRYRNYCRHVTSCLRTKQKGPKWFLTH